MLSRREFVTRSAASACACAYAAKAAAEAILTDDGLHKQPWFLESFLELADDLAGAAEKRRRLVIAWELRGCPACRRMHQVNLAKPEIESYIRQHFDILQLNIIGAREVTDFDGEKLPEKRLAAKFGVRVTPTLQFFPEAPDGLGSRVPSEREVARIEGYFEPAPFLATFKFVVERAYEQQSLGDYLRANAT